MVTNTKAKKSSLQTDYSLEDPIYEQIHLELLSGNLHTPTWLKAYALAEGEDSRAKAKYIELRFERLINE